MVIYNNLPAASALRNLQGTEWGLQKSMERLSSGLRVNRAADDASGFAMSEQMRRQTRGMATAQKNALDGISLLQVADAAYSSTLELLQRINELTLLAANSDKTGAQRDALQAEVDSLLEEINLTGLSTTYNGKEIVAPGGGTSGVDNVVAFQIGPQVNDVMSFTIGTAASITGISDVDLGLEIGTFLINGDEDGTTAKAAIQNVIDAIDLVTATVAEIGAYQNRLKMTIDRLGVVAENIKASESRIRDLDVSVEIVNFTRLQIMQQAGTAMLAQANLAPQTVLQLLK